MSIPFIQYLRPLGHPKSVKIDRPPEIEKMAATFLEAGGRFECEVLTTGEISLTAVKEVDGQEQDVEIEVCENGPDVPKAVDELVKRATLTSAERG